MAVTTVREKWQGRGASTDEKGVRTLTRQWDVATDSDETGEPDVINGLIAVDASATLYASHPKWAWAVCRRLVAAPNGGPRAWTVRADYSSAPFEAKGDGSGTGSDGTGSDGSKGNTDTPSPLQANNTPADQRPPTLSVTRKEVTVPLEVDAETGDPVANTLTDPFVPPVEVFHTHHLITWKIYRKKSQLDWDNRSQWMNTINQDEVDVLGRVYPAHSLRCVDYSLQTVWETGDTGLHLFFELSIQAEYKPDLWDVVVLNAGRRYRVSGSINDPAHPPVLRGIVDDAGQEVSDPVPLTADGTPVRIAADFHYLTFAGYLEYPWNGTGDKLTGAGGILE